MSKQDLGFLITALCSKLSNISKKKIICILSCGLHKDIVFSKGVYKKTDGCILIYSFIIVAYKSEYKGQAAACDKGVLFIIQNQLAVLGILTT